MIKDVRLKKFQFRNGIGPIKRGFPFSSSLIVFGGDTETIDGDPYTVQIFSEEYGGGELKEIERVNASNIFSVLMRMIQKRARKNSANIVFFHNLNFDLRVIFSDSLKQLYDQYNEIHFKKEGWSIDLIFGKVNAATLKKDGLTIQFLDSMAFCPPGARSLSAALKIHGINEKKMTAPEGLGERRLWTEEFREYALNDARAEFFLGNKILNLHRDYDISPTYSLPMFAGSVLRRHFFAEGERISFPPDECRKAAEFAYHAGKNGFYVERGVYEDVYEYDINSAFPHAMANLPQFCKGNWANVLEFKPGLLGVYEISGYVGATKYPALWDHEFKRLSGQFKNIWVTGHEVELAREDSAYSFKIKQGWVWVPHKYEHNALSAFVKRFYNLKATTEKGPKREQYKNTLNSAYGKFAGAVEKRGVFVDNLGHTFPITDESYFVAGSLYQPFIAAQITGAVRATLTRLERQSHALHSATDSIKTFKKMPTSNELGGLKEEVFGRCYLFRTKLYLHFAKDASRCGHDLKSVKIWDGDQHLCKYALHGFKGSVEELFKNRFKLLKEGMLKYEYQHMTGLREGFRRKEKVNKMTRRSEVLNLGGIK